MFFCIFLLEFAALGCILCFQLPKEGLQLVTGGVLLLWVWQHELAVRRVLFSLLKLMLCFQCLWSQTIAVRDSWAEREGKVSVLVISK